MASWKERGEVPDSDEEWDLEGQSIEQHVGDFEPGLETALDDMDEEVDMVQFNGEQSPLQNGTRGCQAMLQQEAAASKEVPQPDASSPEPDGATKSSASKANDPSGQFWPSFIPTNVFRIPDLEGLSEDVELQETTGRISQQEPPIEDDVSRSYVQITSPVSTQLSSPPGSALKLPALQTSKSGSDSNGFDILDGHRDPSEQPASDCDVQQPEEESTYPMKRALRQRNAIQLHPYVVEQEKYRRTLKARGIAPMRMASSQPEPRHAPRLSRSPDPDFRDPETQEADGDTGESQAMDFDWDPPPSSSPPRPAGTRSCDHAGAVHEGDTQSAEEDDLPGLDELLRWPRDQIKTEDSTKRDTKKDLNRSRMKSYGKKFKRPSLPRIFTKQAKSAQSVNHDRLVYEIPASPPTTSSPFSNLPPRHTGASLGGARCLEPSPSWLSQDEVQLQKTGDLPTPATSAVKPAQEPINLDSGSESDDPFASDVENSTSSSDESVQIRKISKKIRGVLPASHLRLDQQKKQQTLTRTNRDDHSEFPAEAIPRRGIALPRTQPGLLQKARSPTAISGVDFDFSDESEGNVDNERSGLVMEDDDASQLESLFTASRMGYAEEDDRIDAMLPSRKRPYITSHRLLKKRKTGPGSSHRRENGTVKRQLKITDHLAQTPGAVSRGMLKSHHQHKNKKRRNNTITTPEEPPPLGILDVADTFASSQGTRPDFIRIAARAARSRTAKGRHKPAGKFFRLSTREDTEDVQSVLQEWTTGRLQQRGSINLDEPTIQVSREPLSHIQNNHQSLFEPPIAKSKPATQSNRGETSGKLRKLLVSKRQKSMNDFISKDQDHDDVSRPLMRHQPNNDNDRMAPKRPRYAHHSARPAQLEAPEKDYSSRYPSTHFKSNKRALDALYRTTRRRPVPSANLQLSRFLADEDIVRPSIEAGLNVERKISDAIAEIPVLRVLPQRRGRQKQRPQRVDIGAAVYRQPSDPLILHSTVPELISDASSDCKLKGLAKFGTKYTRHFDILPLPPGVFFHASTFVGSGRLSELINDVRVIHPSSAPIVVSLNLAKTFTWTQWDGNVSSEVGLCFDWLVDQLECEDPSQTATMDVVLSVTDYVQRSPAFEAPFDERMFLSRMLEVVRDFSSRIQISKLVCERQLQIGIQVLSRICALTLRLLCIARTENQYASLAVELEDVLKATARQSTKLLMSKDLSVLRKLYDDLQYLSFRDNGIRSDQYVVEAWVILIKVLYEARISRGSFWDVVNPVLMTANITKIVDAPKMEKIWYILYTLLPLCEFDQHGVVIQGSRQKALFDNWHVPQQMLKQIFSLYTSNPRQSPGFNDYCRSIVSRCHYLMVEWGWWNSSSVIGTLFDFFASHNLAHLRNEEVYTSPHFLEQLDQNPSLEVEAEDRCFHIFLKIVALGLKQYSNAGDVKIVRNLVARLLPNHDRHYPKDQPIHQKDLAPLRNHHDLLCTLFWSCPPSQGPSITMIEGLVEREQSHSEAFLIHIRTLGQLFRFPLASLLDSELYKLLKGWQDEDLLSLMALYAVAEQEARDQAVEGITEAQIAEVSSQNREQITRQILLALSCWEDQVRVTKSGENAKRALNADLLTRVFMFLNGDDPTIPDKVIFHRCLAVVNAYVEKVQDLRPPPSQKEDTIANAEDDSQGSLSDADWYLVDMASPLQDFAHQGVLVSLAKTARACLKGQWGNDVKTMIHMVHTWARLASLLTQAGAIKVEEYLISGPYAIFEYRYNPIERQGYSAAREYWPYFLIDLMQHCTSFQDLKTNQFNVIVEWLLVLIHPGQPSVLKKNFTAEIVKKYPYLCFYVSTETSPLDNVKGAIRAISNVLSKGLASPPPGFDMSSHDAAFTITALQLSMQEHLLTMTRGSIEHIKYMTMARNITSHIKAYGDGQFKVEVFFTRPSGLYWPDEEDPLLFEPTLISYCVRLEKDPKKEAPNLFHYLYLSWQTMVKFGHLKTFKRGIQKGMRHQCFVEFMLEDFIPIAIRASFKTHCWLLCSDMLGGTIKPIKSYMSYHSVANMFENRAKDKMAFYVYKNVLNILKLICNMLHTVEDYNSGTLKTCLLFWMEIAYDLRLFVNTLPEYKPWLRIIGVALEEFKERGRERTSGFDLDQRSIPYHEFDVHDSGRLDGERAITDLINYTNSEWELVNSGEEDLIRSVDGKYTLAYHLDPERIFNEVMGSTDIWLESLED